MTAPALVCDSQEWPFTGAEAQIGRSQPEAGIAPSVDLTPLDPERSVSRRHAVIHRVDDGSWCIRDLGSINGTTLDGTALAPHRDYPLRDGAKLRFGDVGCGFVLAHPETVADPRPGSVASRSPAGGSQAGERRIFLCYRRDDSRWPTGRLADALCEHFGRNRVFMDVEHLRVGNWRDQIKQSLDASSVVVVVIGPGWAAELARRDPATDQVRYEISTAAQRGSTLVPVLVDGARMPEAADLDDATSVLADQEAYQLREDKYWRPTLDVLLAELGRVLASDWSLGGAPDSEPRTEITARPASA